VLAFLVFITLLENSTTFVSELKHAIVFYSTTLWQLRPLKQTYPALIPGFTHSEENKQL